MDYALTSTDFWLARTDSFKFSNSSSISSLPSSLSDSLLNWNVDSCSLVICSTLSVDSSDELSSVLVLSCGRIVFPRPVFSFVKGGLPLGRFAGICVESNVSKDVIRFFIFAGIRFFVGGLPGPRFLGVLLLPSSIGDVLFEFLDG